MSVIRQFFSFRLFTQIAMSTIGDYKLYKQFAPQYPDWKYSRDLAEAKRQEYIRQNPEAINKKDIL